MEQYTIVGAGLVGTLQSVFLAQKGYRVDIFERRPDMRDANIYGGRSINLAMSNRGWRALANVGIDDQIREIAIPMYRRTMHDIKGNLTFQPYGKENEAIYSVSRAELNKLLLNLADDYATTRFHFNRRCTDIDLAQKTICFSDDRTGEQFTHAYDKLIGTDGAYSAVRHRLMFTDRFDYSQDYIDHGYKELSIEPDDDGNHRLEKNTLHIWPREDFMMIALPNIDGSFTCTLFLSFDGAVSFSGLNTEPEVLGFFQYYFPDVLPLIPDLLEQFFTNPTSSLITTRCYPWHYKDDILLMGDAAHAIVPFYGQGMNAGFEDCTIFNHILVNEGGYKPGLFEKFGKQRKPDADAVAELALRNFIEMRDLTADPEFLLRKKIEARFSALYPDKWVPLYSMVTFMEYPYSEAMELGRWQDSIMEKVMQVKDIENRWESPEVEAYILELIDTSQNPVRI